MKLPRLGNTEFNLMFAQYCIENTELHNIFTDIDKHTIHSMIYNYIDWLYKTGGYYDKSVPVFNRYTPKNAYTDNFKRYIDLMLESIRNTDIVYTCPHTYENFQSNNPLFKYVDVFKKDYNIKILRGDIVRKEQLFSAIHNKKVLVISSFKELIDKQIESGNIYNVFPEYKNVTFITYNFPYTLQNSGPHSNSFETLEHVYNDIKNNYSDFDVAILGCGSYGTILMDKIEKDLGKDSYYLGGQITAYFGIMNKRDKESNSQNTFYDKPYEEIKDYLIMNIPDEYKPECYTKIEDGCYW